MPELSTILAYSIGAFSLVLALIGASLVVSRIVVNATPLTDVLQRLDRLEIAFEGFSAQYGLTNTQTKAQIGKLRRQLARERGEDDEDDDGEEGAGKPVSPVNPAPTAVRLTKDDLRRMATQQGLG